ncbi:MAG: phosphoribosylanthranilate isomerase [Myxococcota bacterium]|nr:phosphoribosylanthranilate isomerase [Myxococcota bacterium]
MKVKICGITREEDAHAAVACGAAYVGFIFHAASPRYVTPERARQIVKTLPSNVEPVGVFVDADALEVRRVVDLVGLSVAQLHGDETPEHCQASNGRVWKALRVSQASATERAEWLLASAAYSGCEAMLLDAKADNGHGGTGKTSDWHLAASLARTRPVVLAGGLSAANVVDAVKAVTPWALDVSSGVEDAPGRKSEEKMRAFFAALRSMR